jgi:hypothetical protein
MAAIVRQMLRILTSLPSFQLDIYGDALLFCCCCGDVRCGGDPPRANGNSGDSTILELVMSQ